MQYLDSNNTFWMYKLYVGSIVYFDNIGEKIYLLVINYY
jgi:hypothetical protein